MNAQLVQSDFSDLGGYEGVGSQGGYYNIRSRFPELVESELVQRWLRKRQPTTKAEYLLRFEKLLNWTKTQVDAASPQQLLAWAKRQPDGTIVQDLIDEYTEKMSKSNGHIATALFRSFLSRNGYRDLPKIDWTSTMSFSEGYTREQIQNLLDYLPKPLHKLYVLAGKDSGLRANDLLYVRWKHIAKDYESGKEYVFIEFEKERYERRKAPGRTFWGPNTIQLLKRLIAEGLVKKETEAQIFPFAYRSITIDLTRAKRKAGLASEIQPNHGLRKFFENCLDRVGMDHNKKMMIEGHSNGVRAAYTSRDIEQLRELYGQAYRFLDLSEKAVVNNEVMDLHRKIRELEEEKKNRNTEIEDIYKQLAAIRRDMEKEK
jgi:integrase